MALRVGSAIIYRHEAYDVVRITSHGDMLIRNCTTREELWVDYYDTGLADPYSSNPGALLDALATIGSRVG